MTTLSLPVDRHYVGPVDLQTKPASSPAPFREDIEGLRGIAVLLVVGFHCGLSLFRTGFIGVDVFFVLSGYLITGQLVAEHARTGRISLAQFYARRVRRLLPAATAVLLVTLGTSAVLLAPREIEFAGRAARAAAIYLTNVFFARDAANYFAPNVETNPVLQMWTLAVEEQFYLVWPLLLIVGLRWRSRVVGTRLLAGLAVVSLAASVWLTRREPTFAFYELPSRAWEFAAGGLAALAPAIFTRSRQLATANGWLGLAIIGLFSSMRATNSAFPGWIAVIPVMGTVAVLLSGHAGAPVSVLRIPPLQWLGRQSYSWYLWHWPFLVLSSALLPGVSIFRNVVAISVALAVAAAAHRWIEDPIRFHRGLVGHPWKTLVMGAALMTCSLVAAQAALRFAHHLTQDPGLKSIEAASLDIANMPRERCVTLGTSPDVKTCAFGDTASEVNVVLFGDSHAVQWFNGLERLSTAHHWRLITIMKSGCAAVDANLSVDESDAANEGCAEWRRAALRTIAGLHPSIVVMSNSTGWRAHSGGSLRQQIDEWRLGTARTLSALSPSADAIVVLRDTPSAPFDVPTCLARSARHRWYPGRDCEFQRSQVIAPSIYAAEQEAAAGLPNVRFADLTDALCSPDRCVSRRGDVIGYRDDNHLTGAMSASLAPTLDKALGRLARH